MPYRQRSFHPRQPQHAPVDPLAAGERVMNGVVNNDLFILSHPEFKPGTAKSGAGAIVAIEVSSWYVHQLRQGGPQVRQIRRLVQHVVDPGRHLVSIPQMLPPTCQQYDRRIG